MLIWPINDINFDRVAKLDIHSFDIVISDSNRLMIIRTTKLNTIAIFIFGERTNELSLLTFDDINNTTFGTSAIVGRRADCFDSITIEYPTHLLFMQKQIRHIAQ